MLLVPPDRREQREQREQVVPLAQRGQPAPVVLRGPIPRFPALLDLQAPPERRPLLLVRQARPDLRAERAQQALLVLHQLSQAPRVRRDQPVQRPPWQGLPAPQAPQVP